MRETAKERLIKQKGKCNSITFGPHSSLSNAMETRGRPQVNKDPFEVH